MPQRHRTAAAAQLWSRRMTITIHVEGARPEEIIRGLLAAQRVFDRAGVSPDEAATARFVVEGWDIEGFPEPAPDAELAISHVWDEADQAAVTACCAGWRQDKIPGSADLELVTEPVRFRLTPAENDQDRMFETAEAGILQEICQEGYFDEGRPEDKVAYLLNDWDFRQFSQEQRRLYEDRIRPLMRIWTFERPRFEEEYARRRTEWEGELAADARQTDLFAA
jgi:hypothetical protein